MNTETNWNELVFKPKEKREGHEEFRFTVPTLTECLFLELIRFRKIDINWLITHLAFDEEWNKA